MMGGGGGTCTCTHVPVKAAVSQNSSRHRYRDYIVTGALVWCDPEALCLCVGYGWADARWSCMHGGMASLLWALVYLPAK